MFGYNSLISTSLFSNFDENVKVKSIFEKVSFPEGGSIHHGHFHGFGAPFAHHPEYEVVYIVRGRGTRVIGQRIEAFEDGDLLLLGPNLPHWWKPLRPEGVSLGEEAHVVQFPETFFDHSIFDLVEFAPLKELTDLASRGATFKKTDAIVDLFRDMDHCPRPVRWLRLMELLVELHRQGAQRLLLEIPYEHLEPERMERAIARLLEDLRDPPPLTVLAEEMGISRVRFSELFKRTTGMNYPRFIHHQRITSICQELATSRRSITDMAHDHGYQNLSTFHRAFRQVTETHPLDYRRLGKIPSS